MLQKLHLFFLFPLLLILFSGCNTEPVAVGEGSKIIGTVTYDRVPSKVNAYGEVKLDYNNIQLKTAKYVVVKALDENDQVLAETTTNGRGEYVLYVPKNTNVKIRVYARMLKKGVWDLSVVDNTNMKAQYVIEGGLHNSGDGTTKRDLRAASGWDGYSYSGSRDAAPFAILDSINTIMQKVLKANPNIKFPHLLVNWSPNNVAAGGDPSLGQIVTSNYDGNSNLWILGDANSDTDEYDDHIIIHEWSHFFEDKFSRSDSIGGPHSAGDSLDIRVAFGEGFGNAMSAIATDNPIYFDTSGPNQSTGWFMNIESATPENPGWFSEASVQRILYDLYDANNDGTDNLHLGFKSIFNAMIDKERNANAFTSIFTFITALKSENPSKKSAIDNVIAGENISPIRDIYGNYRTNSAQGMYTKPVYRKLEVGKWVTQCNQNTFGVYNKLGNRTYMTVSIDSSDIYTISAKPYGGEYGDPDIVLYKAEYPFKSMGMSPLEGTSSDELTINLTPGKYMAEVYDASFNNSCFVVALNKGAGSLQKTRTNKLKPMMKRRPRRMPQY